MPPREWTLYIEDILDAITKIQRYTEGMDLTAFRESDITVDAVVRNLTIIGEAARQVPQEIQARYPDIPWKRMRGLRNVVVHQYFGVGLSILWETIGHDLPPLVPMLKQTLERES